MGSWGELMMWVKGLGFRLDLWSLAGNRVASACERLTANRIEDYIQTRRKQTLDSGRKLEQVCNQKSMDCS